VRGALRYGNNHFPIESFYLEQVAKGADGALGLKTIATIVENSQDKFHDNCPMN